MPASPGYAAWMAAPPGTAVPVAASDVTGLLPSWLLVYLRGLQARRRSAHATPPARRPSALSAKRAVRCPPKRAVRRPQPSLTLELYAVRYPTSVFNADTADITAALQYCFYNLSLDLALLSVTPLAGRLPYLRFSAPVMSYAHVVVAPRPAPAPRAALTQRVWTWLNPFSWGLWGALLASIAASSLAYHYSEAAPLGSPLGAAAAELRASVSSLHPLAQGGQLRFLRHSVFIACMSLLATNNEEPRTTGGEIQIFTRGLAYVIIMARPPAASSAARGGADLVGLPPFFAPAGCVPRKLCSPVRARPEAGGTSARDP